VKHREKLTSWQNLVRHSDIIKGIHMNDLFCADKQRFEDFSIKLPSMLIDYSKNLMTKETISMLIDLAKECEIEQWREKMYSGERINRTEDRSVLHTLLRNRDDNPFILNGKNIKEDIDSTLKDMEAFTECVRQGKWKGYSGKRITDVVNIGVGGSNLGPQMVTEALKQYSDNSINVHYVSNVDGTQIANVLRPLNPEKVLFIVSSKTFTTTETMTNAQTAIKWLLASSFDSSAISKHFVAVSANKENALNFGIAAENIFDMWDWVGGRFSLWSVIGLPIALDLGFDKFIILDKLDEIK
jgi:glucose-6-phosphate isomerase